MFRSIFSISCSIRKWSGRSPYYSYVILSRSAASRRGFGYEKKILESQDKNYFSILVNSDMVVFLLYDGDALIKDIANKVRQILGIAGEPTVTHRNRPLNLSGTISSNWIRAGNKFSMDFSWSKNNQKCSKKYSDPRICDFSL